MICRLLNINYSGSFISFSALKNVNFVYAIVIVVAAFLYFIFMHSSIGKYACGSFNFLMPTINCNCCLVLYWIAFLLLFVLVAPDLESKLYGSYGSTNSSHAATALIFGFVAGLKSLWIFNSLYQACTILSFLFILLIWIAVQIFASWAAREWTGARQIINLCIYVGAVIVYCQVSFVKHPINKSDPSNFWNKLCK
mgnify:CR=1 FL=1